MAASRWPERVVSEPRDALDEHRVVPDAGHDPATQPRARAPRVGQDPFDELAHRALVPEPAACGERARAHGPRRAQLPEPGRDDGVHDLSGRGGDEDVAGMGRAGEGGATGERVRQVYDPVTTWKSVCCIKVGLLGNELLRVQCEGESTCVNMRCMGGMCNVGESCVGVVATNSLVRSRALCHTML